VSQERQNKELSINYEDDQKDYEGFDEFLKENTERQKEKTAQEFADMGDYLLKEIDHKKSIKNVAKRKLIKYIMRKTNKYMEEYLWDLEYNDVNDIFDEVKLENKSFLKKVMEFFF